MGFFGTDKKNISHYEWKEQVRSELFGKDLTSEEIDRIEGLFWTDIQETSEYEKGIDKQEFESKMTWLSDPNHARAFMLSAEKIALIREVMEKYLA